MTGPTNTPTRTLHGIELPAVGSWQLDPGHAEVGFVGRHFLITKIRGRFLDVQATVTVAEQPEDSRVEATIAMASVDTGDATRDDHLRSGDLFDVEHHPTATFRSTGMTWAGRDGRLTGDLTIKGITRPITLDVAFLGAVIDPWGNQRAVFEARGRINREDHDVTWNMVLESGGLLVSKEIDLICNVELIHS